MAFFETIDEFGTTCKPCQAYEANVSPCASEACPQGFMRLEKVLPDGGTFVHCSPIVNGSPSCKGYLTPDEQSLKSKIDTYNYVKAGAGVLIALLLVSKWRSR